jgi:large subunit ribosomal protein L20
MLHAGQYAYHGRKLRKRNMRRLWITRISEAVKQEGISYSRFVHGLAKAKIGLDRKILAQILAEDQAAFKQIVQKIKNFI